MLRTKTNLFKKIWDFLGVCNIFRKQKGNLYIFHKTKSLMNSPTLCWFSNRLCSQVSVRTGTRRWFCSILECAEDQFVLLLYTMYHLYNFTFETNVNFSICNVMVVYFTYYLHWIWYSTWSQPRKCFRLRFSGCDRLVLEPLFIVKKVYQTLHGIRL